MNEATASEGLVDTPSPDDLAELLGGAPRIEYSSTRVRPVSLETLRARRVIAEDRGDKVSNAYKILRTQVLQRLLARGWRSIAVTSPGTIRGRSLTAVNLALGIAREYVHTVLLVDLDLRRPSLHRYFNYTPDVGLLDHLLFDAPLSQVLMNPGIQRLVLLSNQREMSDSAEVLRSPRMTALARELKERYDNRIVIYDLPPILETDDALAFMPCVDGYLVVAEEGKTTKEALHRAVTLIPDEKLIGVMLDRVAVNGSGSAFD